MKRRILRVGPGAASLLLAMVVVSMSILSWLALISARNDHKLTTRGIEFAVADYQKSAEAEYAFARLDALAAECGRNAESGEAYLEALGGLIGEDMCMAGDIIFWEHSSETGRTLKCAVRVLPLGSDVRLEWNMHMFVPETEAAQATMYMESVE